MNETLIQTSDDVEKNSAMDIIGSGIPMNTEFI